MKRVLVTGGTGFVGARTIPILLSRGYEVVGLARSTDAASRLSTLGAESVEGDLDDPSSLSVAFAAARADALVNIASLGFGHGPDIVDATVGSGLDRCVFVSTTAIFTKLDAGTKSVRVTAENAIRASGLDFTILRPTMIYGTPDDRNLARLLKLLRRMPVFPLVGGGQRLQQPVHVDDVAAAIVDALEAPAAIGREYDIAGPRPIPFGEMIGEAADAVSRRVVKVPIPLAPVVHAARLYERVSSRPRIKAEQFERLGEDKSFDISAAVRDFGFAPRPFADGIRAEAQMISAERSS